MRTLHLSIARHAAALVILCGAVGTAQAQEVSGAAVWATNCGRCHRLRSVDTFTASQWNTVATHMGLIARLTPAQTRAVREFLVGSGRAALAPREEETHAPVLVEAEKTSGRTAPLSILRQACCPAGAGTALFRVRCAPCHGNEGHGDGPAAAAMNPRPINLADPTKRTVVGDSATRVVIAGGRRAMPAFARVLNAAQIDTLVFFVGSLSPRSASRH